MALLTLNQVSLSFGGPPLLDGITLEIQDGERICLLGRNGEGKSSLMKLITGELPTDSGDVIRDPGTRIALLRQEIPETDDATVAEVVEGPGDHHDWERHARAAKLIDQLGLVPDTPASDLSAGLKRRLILARELVENPALLLLDEPTNHLDIESILWLESFLADFSGTLLFVTHDRAFLQRLATRILELDRGNLTSWSCDYETYLRRRDAQLEAESKQQAAFDKKLAQEESWLRQGIKARRTRNEGRVRALKAMREERRTRRNLRERARFSLQEDERSGEKVIVAENISFAYGAQPIVKDFSTRIMRGDRVGILGPNGAGKTTLLRLLLGDLAPRTGTLTLGSRLQVAYFDQLREKLDLEKTVQENVAGDNDRIEVQGKSRHVISYLRDFLFTPEQTRSKVKSLSGGERNRLLLARLFTRPSNLLVLDEPTNDLDMETLELLEERLVEYNGTLLLVSHDRAFLDNAVTQLLALEGNGRITEYLGGYDDYLRQTRGSAAAPGGDASAKTGDARHSPRIQSSPFPTADRKHSTTPKTRKPRKFLNRERRELEELPGRIEGLENELEQLGAALADPALYKESQDELSARQSRLDELQAELNRLYHRWEELENLRESLED